MLSGAKTRLALGHRNIPRTMRIVDKLLEEWTGMLFFVWSVGPVNRINRLALPDLIRMSVRKGACMNWARALMSQYQRVLGAQAYPAFCRCLNFRQYLNRCQCGKLLILILAVWQMSMSYRIHNCIAYISIIWTRFWTSTDIRELWKLHRLRHAFAA